MSPTTLALALASLAFSSARLTPASEDEVCLSLGTKEWKCTAREDCRGGISRSPSTPCEKPLLCCFRGRPSRQTLGRKANSYCEDQLRQCRPLYVGDSDQETGKEDAEYDINIKERVVDQKEHPYMALIAFGDSPRGKKWSCGGTLISDQFILTTAKCALDPKLGPARWVSLGSGESSSEFQVAERIVHPLYANDSLLFDVALLRLPAQVPFTDLLQPACLSTMTWVPYENLLALGWTRTSLGRTYRNVKPALLQAVLQTKNITYCPTIPKSLDPTLNSEPLLCAGDGGKEICRGLAGVSLVVRKGNRCLRSVLGLASVDNCSLPVIPSHFTRVSYHLQWIEDTVWP